MNKLALHAGLLVTAVLLTACGEKPQVAATKKSDAKPWEGASGGGMATGWKSGDQASWNEHMRTRTQQGQNEYTRTAANP